MGNKFYIKIQNKKQTLRQKLLVVGMGCFLTAIILQMLSANYFALGLLVPFLYLLYLYRHLRGSKYQMIDAVCELFFFSDNFTICFEPECYGIKGTCRIMYDDLKTFNIYEDGKIEILFQKGSMSNGKIVKPKQELIFYMNLDDKEVLKERLYKVINKR